MASDHTYFNEGKPVDGKGFIVKYKDMKEMAGDKTRLALTDTQGNSINNMIVTTSLWKTRNVSKGENLKILLAKTLKLKNGRPAYLLRDWETVASQPKAAAATKKAEVKKPLGNSSNIEVTSTSANMTTLSNLSPYSNVWEIEVTLLKKDPVREWKKPNSEGKVQNLMISDDSGVGVPELILAKFWSFFRKYAGSSNPFVS